MKLKNQSDVVVVGAGPVGLFAAYCLAKKGAAVQIVDTGIWPCARSYALALHPATVDLLYELGLADPILRLAHPVHRIAVYDNFARRAEIDARGNARNPLYVLPQDVLEQALESALESLGVQVLWRCEAINTVDHADHVTVSMDQYKRKSAGYAVSGTEWTVSNSQSVDVPFVVGAEGFHSGVRRSLGIDFPEVAPSSCYAIFEFVSDARCAEEVRLITGQRTTDVLWPLGNGSFRWSFELPDYNADVEPAATYRHRFTSPAKRVKDRQPFTATGPVELLSETQLSELIRRRAPWFDAPVEMITWRTIARFERRLASEFGKGRCWLVGDAAHLTGPVGVQSMNVGFQEAHELSTLLTQVLHSQAPLSVLQNYAAHWSSEWRQLLGIDDGVPAGSTPDSSVEENRARLASCLPAYGADLFALADQIGAGF